MIFEGQYEIRKLTEYQTDYSRNEKIHKISINNLNNFILNAIDTLYITYSLNDKFEERVLLVYGIQVLLQLLLLLIKNIQIKQKMRFIRHYQN